MNDMLEYFQRVVVLHPTVYFSVHCLTKGGMPGFAFQDYQSAIDYVNKIKSHYDVYMGMGAQVKRLDDGGAIRKLENTCAARCLYLDIDVKKDAYASTQDAAKALKEFCDKIKLPQPTVIVASGTGGFHVYWTLSKLIKPDEFKLLAGQLSSAAKDAGLLFDSNCTTDMVRLLRVPGTLNFKTNPPSPVRLVHAGSVVDIDVMRNVLAQFKPIVTPRVSKPPGKNADLGYGPKSYARPTIEQVATYCPFIKETLETGGVGQAEPLWHDAITVACHCVDSSAVAHRLSDKHATYDHDATEKKLAEAQKYRQDNSTLGPPRCTVIHDDGASQCNTCPHLSLGTSPVVLPFKLQLNGHTYLSDLPAGFFRGDDEQIYVEEVMEKGSKPDRVVVFPYQIVPNTGYLEGGNNYRLTFTTWHGEQFVQKTFAATAFASNVNFHTAFLDQGLAITTSIDKARKFFVSYIKLLQSKKSTMITVPPLGWTLQDGEMGFAYDGEFVTPRVTLPCRHPGVGVEDYHVTGDDDTVWRDMANMVLTPDRPDLMVLASTAFSAPLVKMSGQNGYLMGAWSRASGVGKTTALMLSQSVWAPPVLGGYGDTINYTFDKCASLQDLPIMIDEVKGELQTANFVQLVFSLTSGHEKGRADRKGNMRKQRTWATNIAYAANTSIVEAAAEQTQGTHASVYRMFEFQALNRPFLGLTTDMAELTTKLKHNYGHIGKAYATYLGQNYDKLHNDLLSFQRKIENDLAASNSERYWIAAMSTTLFGAWLASDKLGLAPFDISVMKKFMVTEFARMRNDQATSISDYTNPEAVYAVLAALFREQQRHLIIVDQVPIQAGRPKKNSAKIINDKVQWDEIGLQISGAPLTLRISDAFLTKWCKDKKKPKTAFTTALHDFAGASKHKSRLAAGTRMAQQDEWLWLIPVTGTPLENYCEYAIQHGLVP